MSAAPDYFAIMCAVVRAQYGTPIAESSANGRDGGNPGKDSLKPNPPTRYEPPPRDEGDQEQDWFAASDDAIFGDHDG